MNPQSNDQVVKNQNERHPVNQITPFSKYLALALFIILPFIGGYVGYIYAPEKQVEVTVSSQNNQIVATSSNAQINNVKNTGTLQIVNCEQGTDDVTGLPLSFVDQIYDTYRGGDSNVMNDDYVKLNLETKSSEKVGFYCTLSDDSVILSIFNSTGPDVNLSIVRIADGEVQNEVLSKAEQFSSDTVIVPKFDSTTVAFEGHIIDPCYDLTQNFKFDLMNFSLNLVNTTGGDIPNCKANI